MNIAIDERFAPLVESLIKSGRYASAEDVLRRALLLVEAEEAKLQNLRVQINASIEAGGSYTDEEVSAYLDATEDEWAEEDR